MGVYNKFMNLIGLQEEEELVERERSLEQHEENETPAQEVRKTKGNIVSIHSQKKYSGRPARAAFLRGNAGNRRSSAFPPPGCRQPAPRSYRSGDADRRFPERYGVRFERLDLQDRSEYFSVHAGYG